MTTDEYIDAISRDLQDLINTLDNDPNTSALVKGRAKYIQERINAYYDSLISATKLSERQLTVGDNDLEQVPDAPPYRIGDEGYRDRVTCKGINPCETCSFKEAYRNELPCCNCRNWSEYTLYGVKTDWKKSVRYI